MELERIGVVLRPRESREALDLGTTLLRANAAAVWSAWFAFSAPLFVLCNALALLLGLPWLGVLLTWWLKPLFDRVPLYVLSRAVFDHTPLWRETLRGQRAMPWRPTVAGLTWLRVDSHRALRLPLDLLEGASNKQRAARWKVLRRRLVGEASLLTWGCLQFELVLFLSVWLLAFLLLPDEWRPVSFVGFFRDGVHAIGVGWELAASCVAYLAMSVIEPLYVACGFALYLNRRTQLEAWDIDLAFRRLRARLLDAGKLLGLVLCLCLPLAGHAAAKGGVQAPAADVPQDVFHQPLDENDQRFTAAAARVYRDPRFGGEQHVREWQLKYRSSPAPQRANVNFAPLSLLSGLLNVLLWLVLAAVLAALVWFAWRWSGGLRGRESLPPDTFSLATVDETPEALPPDVAGAARVLWQARRRREALALLYRGCTERVAQQLQLPFAVDATEADWLRHAAALDDPARTQRVTAIVRTWQFAAYANRYPDEVVFERLLEGWPLRQGAQT
jgi:hypothetical protein